MIYFVQETGKPESFIKIGTARCVVTRVQQLEKEYGVSLEILGVCGGDREVERNIHSMFEECRMGPKERFRPTPELLGYIQNWTWPWSAVTLENITQIDQVKTILQWGEEVSWLERFIAHSGLEECVLINNALQLYATHVGFDEPHPDIRSGIHPARKAAQESASETSTNLAIAMEVGWG